MSLTSLISRIVSSPKFQNEYTHLLKKSVCSQIPNIICEDDFNNATFDWSYLISCATILARSTDGKILDIAYRICQATICEPNLQKEYKSAAAMIFDLTANSAAVNLSKTRQLITSDYKSNIPWGTLIDATQKQFSNSIISGDKIAILNEFQKDVYSAFQNSQTVTVSAPTSAGKAFILMHILSDFIKENPACKTVYIVPTRALIQQVEMDIREHLKHLGLDVEVTSVPVLPEHYCSKACTFIFTQERLQWVLNENPKLQFDLVIVDEAHKIGDRARGILLQQVLQQVSYECRSKFIFASPMSENPEVLFKVIKPDDNQKEIVSEIVTVNQNLIWVSKVGTGTTKWDIELLSQGQKLHLGYLECERITKASMRLPILAYRIAAGEKGNLLYVNGAADAEKVAVQLKSLVLNDNPGYSPSQRILELIKLIKKTIHPNYVLIETLKAGVAFHYGNMPLAVRNEIEDLFKIGDISFLVCTSTLIEGVNLPAKSIFVRGPQKGRSTPMNEVDFWNLAGRAGRQGKEFQGNIFCLDAGDDRVWTNGTPKERKKYLIKSTVDTIIETCQSEFIEYIKSKQAISTKSEMDYAYTYFLEVYYKYGKVANSFMPNLYGKELCKRIDEAFEQALPDIEIPSTILAKNQGVNPLAQQKLFQYFKKFERDDSELIPPYPEEDDAQEKYLHIIGRISSNLTGDPHQLSAYRSILITNWMRGYGLARIIEDNIKWNNKKQTGKNTATIIRDTMRDIEEYARFKFLKYTTCYIDVLKLYFWTKGDSEAIKKIPQINLWLEFGASKMTQISLMAMGFTRTAALEYSDLIVDENYTKDQCLQWFLTNNIYSMDLPESIINEAVRIVGLQ